MENEPNSGEVRNNRSNLFHNQTKEYLPQTAASNLVTLFSKNPHKFCKKPKFILQGKKRGNDCMRNDDEKITKIDKVIRIKMYYFNSTEKFNNQFQFNENI